MRTVVHIYIYMSMKHGDVSKGLAEASEPAAPMFIFRIPMRTTCSCRYTCYILVFKYFYIVEVVGPSRPILNINIFTIILNLPLRI